MGKVLIIGWKDMRLAFRDRAGLILMLLAPLLLTVALGFVTGSFTQSSSTISGIPVAVVNLDGGQVGNALVSAFTSPDLSELLAVTILDDAASARELVNEDQTAAAIIIPAGFSESIIPSSASGQTSPVVDVELYANPTRTTSAGVIESILEGFINQVNTARVSGEVAVSMLLEHGLIQPAQAAAVGSQIGIQASGGGSTSSIKVNESSSSGSAVKFNILAFMAPGMALMFLMYTVTNGGRALLYERAHGTLPRLMVAPLNLQQVLGGKLLGVYLTGVIQMLILITASALMFKLQWGNPLNVLVVVLVAVFGALGWGSLVTALAKNSSQVASLGSALMLVFGIMGGTFVSMDMMPQWFRDVSTITPNSWGIAAFNLLARGETLAGILPKLWPLLVMGTILFMISAFILKRRGLFER
ncbi:MAG: ABC transporter permease [Anaerolineaceae bacterium]